MKPRRKKRKKKVKGWMLTLKVDGWTNGIIWQQFFKTKKEAKNFFDVSGMAKVFPDSVIK